jgi:competence protein ComEA
VVNSKWILISILFSQINHAAPENINTVNAQEMAEALYGVGQYKAEAIVQYRSINGPFKTVGEIKRIKRIGQAIIIGNGDDIKVN